MAKVKITDTGETTPGTENLKAPIENPVLASEPKVQTKPQEASEEQSLLVKNVLHAFRAYPQLYIDSFGCAYTPDTPERLRSGARLYKNPFYEP